MCGRLAGLTIRHSLLSLRRRPAQRETSSKLGLRVPDRHRRSGVQLTLRKHGKAGEVLDAEVYVASDVLSRLQNHESIQSQQPVADCRGMIPT